MEIGFGYRNQTTMKKNPKANLENYRKLFFQLGLVLVLFVVYVSINHKSYAKVEELGPANVQIEAMQQDQLFEIEKIKPETPKEKPKTTEIIKKVPDEVEIPESIVEPTDPEEIIDLDDIKEYEEDEEVEENVPFILIENAPIFPGCKSKKQEQIKACFAKKIQKHIARKFNGNLASELGLAPGVKRIHVMFTIDDKGKIVNVQARAPHNSLKKEAIRVINLLPEMTPGSQRGTPVKVQYSLPIVFKVE